MIYKCPVCNGKGTVPDGFYDDDMTETFPSLHGEPLITVKDNTCRSCKGKGFINEFEAR